MDITTSIKQVTVIRDGLSALPQTPMVRDALSRATIFIGKLQLVEDEAKVAGAALADIEQQLATATAAGDTKTKTPKKDQ